MSKFSSVIMGGATKPGEDVLTQNAPGRVPSPAASARNSPERNASKERNASESAAAKNMQGLVPPAVVSDDDHSHASECTPSPHSESFGGKKKVKGGVWSVDTDGLKDLIKERVGGRAESGVQLLYKDTGIWQKIARNRYFENITLCVISANAIWIGYDTDYNTSDSLALAPVHIQVGEHLFCLYFSAELFIRFMAFKYKRDCLKDAWFVFDAFLVFFMVLETWIFLIIFRGTSPMGGTSALFRLLRLLRLTRLIKMLRSFPEAVVLVKGMLTAMQSTGYVLGLLVLVTYVFAIACTQLSQGSPIIRESFFPHIFYSMYSLIVYATFLDDLSDFAGTILEENGGVFFLVTVYIGLSALTIMNMLIGVLCEVISEVASAEKEAILTTNVADTLKGLLDELDVNNNGTVSFGELRDILVMPQALKALEDLGVDPVSMIDFSHQLFTDEHGKQKEIGFEEFMNLVLDLRSSKSATLKDIISLARQITGKIEKADAARAALETRMDEASANTDETLSEILAEVRRISKDVEQLKRSGPRGGTQENDAASPTITTRVIT